MDLIAKAREILDHSYNPLFIYDDDVDGLTSFLILKKTWKKGEGYIAKSAPKLTKTKSVEEHDVTVILDKPQVDDELLKGTVIWVDHHPIQKVPGNVIYIHPQTINCESMPTAHLCQKIAQNPQTQWLEALGCASDYVLTDSAKELFLQHPQLGTWSDAPQEILYGTPFGKIIDLLLFNLKGKNQDVHKAIALMEKNTNILDLLNQEKNVYLYTRYKKIVSEYHEILNQAPAPKDGVLVYVYSENATSFSGELSNELASKHPNTCIIVARKKNDEFRGSLRASHLDASVLLEHALMGVDGYGGGHMHACGFCIKEDSWDLFLERLTHGN
jgi:single-stranded DNA-specific DHH superfamily exonuclease